MDWFVSVIAFIIVAGMCHKMVAIIRQGKTINTQNTESSSLANEEQARRERILSEIHHFLKDAQFFEPVAKWREEDIFRYILNEGYLYEFDEIMPPNHQRIGRDEDYLCFKQLTYKRVMNPEEFFTKHKVKSTGLHVAI